MSAKQISQSFRETKKALVYQSREYQQLKQQNMSEEQLVEKRNQIKNQIHAFVSCAIKTTKMIDLSQKEFKQILIKNSVKTSPSQKKAGFFQFNRNIEKNNSCKNGEDIIINSLEYIWWQNKLMKLKHFKLIFKSLDRLEKGEKYIEDFQTWKQKVIMEGQEYFTNNSNSNSSQSSSNSSIGQLYTIQDAEEEEVEEKNNNNLNFNESQDDDDCSSDSVSDEGQGQSPKMFVNQFVYKQQQFMKCYNKV